jgi:hypothetical protein
MPAVILTNVNMLGIIIISMITLSVIMMSVIMVSVIMISVIMVSVIMLSVVAPNKSTKMTLNLKSEAIMIDSKLASLIKLFILLRHRH